MRRLRNNNRLQLKRLNARIKISNEVLFLAMPHLKQDYSINYYIYDKLII